MSDIDKRVVQMEFDNSKFDKNIKKSSATLDNFEKHLKFKDVANSLNAVKRGFSSFEVAAITTISRITNSIIDLGVKMVKHLTIDRITDGWQKFGDKTVAVATLAAQKIVIAGKELSIAEEKMAGINDQLEKLEWFTNETSYTFNDMVAALGKFTAAGQDLDKSVNAMEGIATWAAMSGANAYKASSAMTQLAQTLGRGYVLRIDWQSIQTLNMDTAMFRNQVLETAAAMGKLKKVGDDFITNTGKKITSINFTETLSSKWFTSDILVKTLEKYSSAVEDIYRISEEEGISARQVIEKYGDTLDQFGVQAFKAAQETRTLGEALSYVMGTIGSTWSKSFEHLIGGYEEAKTIWSDLSDALYDDIIAANDFRNEILKLWKDLDGRADLFNHGEENQGAFWNIYDSIVAVKDIFSQAKNTIFPKSEFESEDAQAKDLAKTFKNFTERLRDYTAQMLKTISENQTFLGIMKGVYSVIKIILSALAGVWNAISPIVEAVKSIIVNLFDRLSVFGNNLSKISGVINSIQEGSRRLANSIEKVIEIIDPEGILNKVFDYIIDIKNLIADTKPIETLATIIENFFGTLEETGGSAENFKRIADGIGSVLSMVAKIVKQIISLALKYVVPIVTKVTDVISKLVAIISGILTEVLAFISDFFTALNDLLEGNQNALNDFGKNTKSVIGGLSGKVGPVIESLTGILKEFINIILLLPKALDDISKALTGKSIIDNLVGIFDAIADALASIKDSIKSGNVNDNNFLHPLVSLLQGIMDTVKGILKIAGPLLTLIGQMLTMVGKIFEKIGEFLDEITEKSWKDYSKATKTIIVVTAIVAAFAIIYTLIRYTIDSFENLISPLHYLTENVGDGAYFLGAGLKNLGIASIIKSIGHVFLEIAASMLIFSKLSKGDFKKASIIVIPIIAILSALIISLIAMEKNQNELEKLSRVTDKFKEGTGKNSVFKELTKILRSIALDLIVLSVAMLMLSKIDTFNDNVMKTFLVSLGIILLAFIGTLFMLSKVNLTKAKSENVLRLLIGFSILLLSVGGALLMIKNVSWQSILSMSLPLTLALAGFIATLILISKSKISKPKVNNVLKVLIGMSVSLLSFGGAMMMMANIPWDKALISVGSLMALILTLGIISRYSNGFNAIALSVSMIILSYALTELSSSIQLMEGVDWPNIAKAFAILGGGLLILALASLAGPGILSLGVGIMALGAGVLFAGLGMQLLATSFIQFCNSVVENGDAVKGTINILITSLVEGLINGVRTAVKLLPVLLLESVEALVAILPRLTAALTSIFVQLTDMVISWLPKIAELAIKVINTLNEVIIKTTPSTVETIFVLIDSLLRSLADHIGSIANSLVDILLRLLDVIMTRLPDIIAKIIDFTYKITYEVTVNVPKLIAMIFKAIWDALETLFPGLTDKIKEGLGKVGEWFSESWNKITDWFKGVGERFKNTGNTIKTWTVEKAQQLSNWYKDTSVKIGNWLKDKALQFANWTKETYQKISNWFKDTFNSIVNWFKDVGNKFKQGWQEFKKYGKELIQQFKDGVKEKWEEFTKWFKEKWENFKEKFKKFWGINSPSKVFEEYGVYLVEGLQKGIEETYSDSVDSMDEVSDGLKDAIDQVADYVEDVMEDDDEIVITPVLDLSKVNSGVNSISSLMRSVSGSSISMSGNLATSASNAINRKASEQSVKSENQNGPIVTNEGDNYYSTFNITTNDPEEFARQADTILQKLRLRANLAKGGAR